MGEFENSSIAQVSLFCNAKEQVGMKRLEEIYDLMSEKVIKHLKVDTMPTNETYRMIAIVQELNDQINGRPDRFPYWARSFFENCMLYKAPSGDNSTE